MERKKGNENLYDAVIIGGGPAGLTAALYLARARYRVIVVEAEDFGGQVTITAEVVNYPGIARTSGRELTDTMLKQAERFGAEFLLARAENLETEGDIKTVQTSRGPLRCFGILLAAGAHPRKIGFQGEEAFRGRGVAYCATCDGEFFADREVFVVGGGFAAAEESIFLTRYASHVTILVREEDFTCAKSVAEPVFHNEKITVLTHTEILSVEGDQAVKKLCCKNSLTGEITEFQASDGGRLGVFVFAGYEPATHLAKGLISLNDQGYVITDRSQQTSIEGVYAAGDICVKPLRQVVTAVGDGALAATELERYAAKMQRKTGLRPASVLSSQKPSGNTIPPENSEKKAEEDDLFSPEIQSQLNAVFEKMESPLILQLYPDTRPVSAELVKYMEALAARTDRLTVKTFAAKEESERPCVRIARADGTDTGLAFHGVPGGHEFTAFVLGLYNASGPGQSLDAETRKRIMEISSPVKIKILVSLSCTLCPELVTAAQHIAALNPRVSAEVYDLNHFSELKDKYQVMSVPCMILNDTKVSFGKKNIRQILEQIAGE
ncbi:MAG: FAD-dependent oxidoreductase [Clostridiales bacterium]|nr:FAD-dependent oxidoreductase [Clostridiales bacterium]